MFATNLDSMPLGPDMFSVIMSAISEIKTSVVFLARLLPKLSVPTLLPDQVFLKLDATASIPEMTTQLTTFHKALEQTILDPKVGGKVELQFVESGSLWFLIALGSTAAVGFVGGLSWAAAVVYKKLQEGKLVQQHVKSLKIKNDALQAIQEAQKAMLSGVVEAEARHLAKEIFGQEENPERLERVKFAIRSFQELIEKGAEVHPALNAPEDVKNLFPDFKKLDLIESKIKKLAETAG